MHMEHPQTQAETNTGAYRDEVAYVHKHINVHRCTQHKHKHMPTVRHMHMYKLKHTHISTKIQNTYAHVISTKKQIYVGTWTCAPSQTHKHTCIHVRIDKLLHMRDIDAHTMMPTHVHTPVSTCTWNTYGCPTQEPKVDVFACLQLVFKL